jgi:hypothetical protein
MLKRGGRFLPERGQIGEETNGAESRSDPLVKRWCIDKYGAVDD